MTATHPRLKPVGFIAIRTAMAPRERRIFNLTPACIKGSAPPQRSEIHDGLHLHKPI